MIYHTVFFGGGFLRIAFGKSSVIHSSLCRFVALSPCFSFMLRCHSQGTCHQSSWMERQGGGVGSVQASSRFAVLGSRCNHRRSVRLTSLVARTRWPPSQCRSLESSLVFRAWPASLATQESNRLLQLLCYLGLRTCQWCGRIWQTNSLTALRALLQIFPLA